jgi:hypothetical protein
MLRPLRRYRFALCIAIAGLAGAALLAQSYDPVGPQTSVALATILAGGWSPCFSSSYALPTGLYVPAIQAGCTGEKTMLACGPAGETTLTVLAQALRSEVFTDPGDGDTDSHLANGAQWYFDLGGSGGGYDSWGFAGAGDAVARDNCDVEDFDVSTRLCWHLQSNAGGYRCGATIDLNDHTDWTKYVFEHASAIFDDDFEATGSVCAWSATAGAADDCTPALALALVPECGATYADQGADDLDSTVGRIGFRFTWNELARESGYRVQSGLGAIFEGEDGWVEVPAGTTQTPIVVVDGVGSWTYRVIAHVGHPPGHGADPIAGDVVSNECTVHTEL